jgi:hypothetical protein
VTTKHFLPFTIVPSISEHYTSGVDPNSAGERPFRAAGETRLGQCALCTMSDAARLMLLKEGAGTTFYSMNKKGGISSKDGRKHKSSIELIHDILHYIDQRLEELRGEKEELTQ